MPRSRSIRLPGWRWPGYRAAAATAGGLILRLWMGTAFPQNDGDALVYGNLAKNLILHGQFAVQDANGILHATLIRLPGYPLFLAACFRIFGLENYAAVAWLQIGLELTACLLLADFVRGIATPRAGLDALWLAAMCPFTAIYASAAYTESLTFDCICLALWSLQRYLSSRTAPPTRKRQSWRFLLLFSFAIGAAAMLRPDGALVALALWPALLLDWKGARFQTALRPALLCALLAVLPFVPWTARNWETFHVFEPLAPRYANDPGQLPHMGWQHWTQTWCLDFASTSEFYWNAPDNPLAFEDLPERAFDSPQQRIETAGLLDNYNKNMQLTPEIDAEFERLAELRTAAHPWRTWLWLPLGRLADMLLRPRVENLPIELRWWQYGRHWQETVFSYVCGGVNLLFVSLGLAGLALRPKLWQFMTAYFVLRCLLLATVEAPETRYTLEFFPIFCATGGIALERALLRVVKWSKGQSRRLRVDV